MRSRSKIELVVTQKNKFAYRWKLTIFFFLYQRGPNLYHGNFLFRFGYWLSAKPLQVKVLSVKRTEKLESLKRFQPNRWKNTEALVLFWIQLASCYYSHYIQKNRFGKHVKTFNDLFWYFGSIFSANRNEKKCVPVEPFSFSLIAGMNKFLWVVTEENVMKG